MKNNILLEIADRVNKVLPYVLSKLKKHVKSTILAVSNWHSRQNYSVIKINIFLYTYEQNMN